MIYRNVGIHVFAKLMIMAETQVWLCAFRLQICFTGLSLFITKQLFCVVGAAKTFFMKFHLKSFHKKYVA